MNFFAKYKEILMKIIKLKQLQQSIARNIKLKMITSKKALASMTFTPEGADIESEYKDTLYGLSWEVIGKSNKSPLNKLNFNNFTNDGIDTMNNTEGYLNFYTENIPSNLIEKYTQAIIYWIKESNAEFHSIVKNTWNDKAELEKQELQKVIKYYRSPDSNEFYPTMEDKNKAIQETINSYNKTIETYENKGDIVRVIRFKVSINPNKNAKPRPPTLNMSNENAYAILQLLNYNPERNPSIPAYEIIMKINLALPRTIQEFTRETTQENNWINMGLSLEQIQERLQKLKEIAEWTIDNGYQNITIE